MSETLTVQGIDFLRGEDRHCHEGAPHEYWVAGLPGVCLSLTHFLTRGRWMAFAYSEGTPRRVTVAAHGDSAEEVVMGLWKELAAAADDVTAMSRSLGKATGTWAEKEVT